jgi:Ca2+-binding RTX toxin-like protein
VPAAANATATCSFNTGTHQLSVKWDDTADAVKPLVDGNDIVVRNFGAPGGTVDLDCGSPTVTTVDRITMTDKTGTSSAVGVFGAEQFAPGATSAGGDAGPGTNEIEFRFRMKGGNKDKVELDGSSAGPMTYVFGSKGFNPNATPGEVSPDTDVRLRGAERTAMSNENDWTDAVDGQGGAGTGSAFSLPMNINAYGGNDRLFGGSGDDEITGGAGADNLRSFKGDDEIKAMDGNADGAIRCGPGNDTAEVDLVDPPAKSC